MKNTGAIDRVAIPELAAVIVTVVIVIVAAVAIPAFVVVRKELPALALGVSGMVRE